MVDAKKTVLIVEDEELLLSLLRDELVQRGYSVLVSKTGEDAVAVLSESHADIQLVALDLMLPKMDGFEVLQRMKEDDRLKDIPVVVLSNLGDDENTKRAMDLGAKGYFVKSDMTPDEIADLVKAIK
jgi:DNA-binding response OmpR family regulator